MQPSSLHHPLDRRYRIVRERIRGTGAAECPTRTIRVFSRDELKQSEMQERFHDDRVRYFIGDVRDRRRLPRRPGRRRDRARRGDEAGAGVRVQPLRGGADERRSAPRTSSTRPSTPASSRSSPCRPTRRSTRSTSTAPRSSARRRSSCRATPTPPQSDTRLSCVRYGNVVGSRGSVVPLFRQQIAEGRLTITDERMTRFWITLAQAVDLVLYALDEHGGRRGLHPEDPVDAGRRPRRGDGPRRCPSTIIGIRPGEKLHEVADHRRRDPPHDRRRRRVRRAPRAPVVDGRSAVGRRQAARRRLRLHQRHERLVARPPTSSSALLP